MTLNTPGSTDGLSILAAMGTGLANEGGLAKMGLGTVTLSGTGSYSGPTTINAGELLVNGTLSNSAVSINGGTLGGTGTLGSVTVNASGHMAPGDLNTGVSSSPATLIFKVATSTSTAWAVPLRACRSRAT